MCHKRSPYCTIYGYINDTSVIVCGRLSVHIIYSAIPNIHNTYYDVL